MVRLSQVAFWMGAVASSFMMAALVLPLWLGHRDNLSNHFWGLWYKLECTERCISYSQVLKTLTVPLVGRTYTFDVVAIIVLVVVALVFASIAMLVLDMLSCKSRYNSTNTRILLMAVTLLFLISSLAALVAFFMGVYLADEFYSDYGLSYASEFPWCLLLWAIATVLVIIATLMHAYIVCNWYNYSEGFGYMSPSSSDEQLVSGNSGKYLRNTLLELPPPTLDNSFRKSRNLRESGYGVSAFSGPSHSDFAKSRPESTYFDFRLSKQPKAQSVDDLRISKRSSNLTSDLRLYKDLRLSKRSLHDSPKVLRHTTPSEYLRDQRDMLRGSRIVAVEEEVIDPGMLSTAHPSYRESRVKDGSGYLTEPDNSATIVSSRREPSILDDLYRASRKSNR